MLCYVMLCYVMLCYVMLCFDMLYYVMLCYLMLSYLILCLVMLCFDLLYYVIKRLFYVRIPFQLSFFIIHQLIDIWSTITTQLYQMASHYA
jgi:hypothetical protein